METERGMSGSSGCCSSSRSSLRSRHRSSSIRSKRPGRFHRWWRKCQPDLPGSPLGVCSHPFANVGTAVVLYPIARRQDKILAIGYVAARIIECVFSAPESSLCSG